MHVASPQRLDFVHARDDVEASLAGNACGAECLAVRFGVTRARFEGLSAAQAAQAQARFGLPRDDVSRPVGAAAAGVRALPPACGVRVVRAERAAFRAIDTRGWEYAMALEHHDDAVVVVGPDFVARVALDGALPAALVATWLEDERVIGPLENTLRVLSAYLCLARGGVLLHCCGVVDDAGGARVCFGPSGIGKSTLASAWLARGRDIVSDELCAVVPEGDGDAYAVEQVPFAGDVAARAIDGGRAPLAGLFRLDQGPVSALHALSPATAAAALFASAPFVNVDELRRAALLANLERMAQRAGVARLVVKLGDDVAPLFASSPASTPAAPEPAAREERAAALAGLSASTSFRLARGVRYRVLDGEALLVLQESAEAVGLNGTGSRAFDLAARGETFGAIVTAIGAEADDVEAAVVERDLRGFFGEIVDAGWLLVREGAAP